jgi:MinD-like ATPase involved in chromosome partitioning or flagellar assembly
MTIRFDDSLPTLANIVAEELGANILESGVVLRDVSGRLAFFSSSELSKTTARRLTSRLSTALGVYGRTDRVVAGRNDFGVAELLTDNSILRVEVGEFRVRLLDRRLVGADWLRAPAGLAPPPPRFVFASLKGGVGRSTALCVAAADIASHGRRVLAIDLDMEAPGLGAMLLDAGTLPKFGLIDALVEGNLSPLDEAFLSDVVGPSGLSDRQGRIDVIPAFGQRSLDNPGDVLAKIARAYAENVRSDGTVVTMLDQIRAFVDNLSDQTRYDAILVDTRAGLHETTASAILGLGAEVFLFGLDEPQTFYGYSALLAHLARFIDPNQPAPEWLDRLTMVQGKAPLDPERRDAFSEKCRTLFAKAGLKSHADVGTMVQLPAEPFVDVPWKDDEVSDEDLYINETHEFREPISILYDERYRLFEPLRQHDLLLRRVYENSFGLFLDRIKEVVLPDGKDPS